jgi:thioredoxin reductase (NADPH)
MYRDPITTELAASPLFASCTEKQLAEVDRLVTKVTVRAGQPLVRQGMPSRQFLILTSGTAEIARKTDGEVEVLGSVGPGEYVGESGLLTMSRREVSVVAQSDCEVLVANRHEFKELLAMLPIVATKIRATAASRVRQPLAV